MAQETDIQKQLADFRERITRLEEQCREERPEGNFSLQIGEQGFEPSMVKTAAGPGVRYLLFRLDSNDDTTGYDQVMDDLTAKSVQETTYSENGEVVLRGRTVEIWQDLAHANYWWAKVEVDAFC